MRILVDVPSEDLRLLKRLSVSRKISRAELVRTAVAAYLGPHRTAETGEAFGLWRADGETGAAEEMRDGLAYQERLRGEW